MKHSHKRELQRIEINHSLAIDFKDFMKIYNICIAEKYSFLVNDTTLALDNSLPFRKKYFRINIFCII